nr:hypothetical protein [Bradyrhizobium sp. CCH5-A9]
MTNDEALVERVRHKVRGSTYAVIGEGEAQISKPTVGDIGGSDRVTPARVLREGDKLVVYRCEQTGKLWLRFSDEFVDGRFEALPARDEAVPASGGVEGDLVSRAEVLRIIRRLGDQDADLALYGAEDNARAREYGEAAATRACCAIALMPSHAPMAAREIRAEIIRLMRKEFDPKPPNYSGYSWDDNAEAVADSIIKALASSTPAESAGDGVVVPDGWKLVPVEPTEDLLRSMAIRYDHGLGVPGYYDQPIFGAENVGHAQRLESTMTTMRQLHEEVVGTGFYRAASPSPPETREAVIRAAEDRMLDRAIEIAKEQQCNEPSDYGAGMDAAAKEIIERLTALKESEP